MVVNYFQTPSPTTKLHGHINKNPIKPIAVTTHQRLLGDIFELYVDVAKKPTQFHKFITVGDYYMYYSWCKMMDLRFFWLGEFFKKSFFYKNF